jgi:hypothetical protein
MKLEKEYILVSLSKMVFCFIVLPSMSNTYKVFKSFMPIFLFLYSVQLFAVNSIDTRLTTDTNGHRNGAMRHTFFDPTGQLHWVIYQDGPLIRSAYSSDGSSWTITSSLSAEVRNIKTLSRVINGVGFVFLVAEESNNDVTIRRGELTTSSIVWDVAETIFESHPSGILFSNPALVVSASKLWVGASEFDRTSGTWTTKVRQSLNSADANLSMWLEPQQIGSQSSGPRQMTLLHILENDIYAIYQEGSSVVGYRYRDATNKWSIVSEGGDLSWFNLPGTADAHASIAATAVFNGDLYVGGDFTSIGGVSANYIAKWDGSKWSSLGMGLSAPVSSLAVMGASLYVGGSFSTAGQLEANRIARWDGNSWSAMTQGFVNGVNNNVTALAVKGRTLYVGGYFSNAGGAVARHIARWNGVWSKLGEGLDGPVFALSFEGSHLVVGGKFNRAGGVVASNIAKFDGASWSNLGDGLDDSVHAIATIGNDLFAAGDFRNSGGVPARHIAKWDGVSWSGLGKGVNSSVTSLIPVDGDLYVGGSFRGAGGTAAREIARWNGSSWAILGESFDNSILDMAIWRDSLYVVGLFTKAGGQVANHIAKWNGTSWSNLGNNGLNGNINALAFMGDDLYIGGDFTTVGGIAANRIAKWDGISWTSLGSGCNDDVNAIAVKGTELFVGGKFTSAGGVPAKFISKWNGNSWSSVGDPLNHYVNALAVAGNELFVGGSFTRIGEISANGVAKWDGRSWSSLGSGIGSTSRINAIAIIGDDIYFGGSFRATSGGVAANNVAKWDGNTWSPLGAGVTGTVYSMAVEKSNLYVGGDIGSAGGKSVHGIAKWDGKTWTGLGSGVDNNVLAITTVGSDLYAGGFFNRSGDIRVRNVAKWDGSMWSSVSSVGDFRSAVRALATKGNRVFLGTGGTISELKDDIAAISRVNEFSATSNEKGEPVIVYNDDSGAIKVKSFSSEAWTPETTIHESENALFNPIVSAVSGSDQLYAFWYHEGQLEFKYFDGSIWNVSPSVLVPPNTRFASCDSNSGGGIIKCLTTKGGSTPFYLEFRNILLTSD